MGVVYKAVDLKLLRTVALKFLPEEVALNEADKQHLLQEARAASALDHPNVGAIYGIEEHDGRLFIVMAYYQGETLTHFLARRQSIHDALDTLIQVARGLAAAHARNIIHRDIKPSNVIVTQEGLVKIVDFGLARVIASASMTQSFNTSGTLPYMAPEQILGEPATPACDVWALGIILAEALGKQHPFARDNTGAMTFAIVNQPPTGLDQLPPALSAIAYKALAKQTVHRYPTAKQMLTDLEAARAEAGTVAQDGNRKTAISQRELKQYAERASSPQWPSGVPRRSRTWLYVALAVVVLAAASLLIPGVRERLGWKAKTASENHIAVLPFDNIGGDPKDDVIAAGLMDTLTGELSNINAGTQTLWVVPASVVRARKITDPGAAAKGLGVNLVVKGSIQRNGEDTRLNLDLIDANDLREIGSASVEDRTGDLSTLQDEAVARLARLMNINVTAEMLRTSGGHASPAAYEFYLKAVGYMQRYDKAGNLDQAVADLNDAVNTDPQFALGFASLGEAYRLKNQVDPNPKWVEQAIANLNHAVQLNDHLSSPFVSLARLHSSLGKNDLALQEFQKAFSIDPRSADAIMGMALAYERMGRIADAEANFKRAIAIRPDYWDGYNSLGFFYYRQHRFQDAIVQFKKVLELTPDNATAYSNLAGMYLMLGDPASEAEAEKALKRSVEIAPSYAAYANLGRMYMDEKRYAESVDVTRKALALNDQDYMVWENLAVAYRWLHDDANVRYADQKTTALLEEYVGKHPQDATAHGDLADLYATVKDREKTQRELATALALQPNDPRVLSDAAQAYEALGDRKRAIEYTVKSLNKGNTLDYFKGLPDMEALLADPNFHAPGAGTNK